MADRRTTCTFCGAGCGLYLETSGGRIVGAYPSRSHPANEGRLCVRGWHAHEIASSPDRLRRPSVRHGDGWREVSWDEALQTVSRRLDEIVARYGPGSVAFLGSPRCGNEEAYLLQKLARAVVGTNAVDHGTGVYAHNSLAPLLEMLGVPASTCSLADLDRSEVIVVDGLDLARRLPTVAGRVLRAKLRGATLVVVGERRHRLAGHADLFLQVRPGTEAALYAAMARVVVDRALVDRGFVARRCAGYEAFAASLEDVSLLAAADACGVAAYEIEDAALRVARARAALFVYSTAAPRPPEVTRALVDLALLTGQIGKPGAGILALTEQNNLQGVCDMGLAPDRLPGHRPVSSPAARAELAALWGTPVPEAPGPHAEDVLADRAGGRVRAAWLLRYDPVSTCTLPDVQASLDGCELVVVQHVFPTETARHADVVLPIAAFGEERVTFTSSERRVQLAEAAVEPPPGVLPAWRQLAEVAARLGADWTYASAAEVMAEIAAAVPAYGAITYPRLSRAAGLQWPCTEARPLGTASLLGEDDADRPLRFAPPAPRAVGPPHTGARPLTLVFGHSDYYWHQDVLVQHSETLRREHRILLLDYPGGFVELNPEDASALGVRDGERIRLCADGGSAVTLARVTPEVRRGAAFAPFFLRDVAHRLGGAGRGTAALVSVSVEKERP